MECKGIWLLVAFAAVKQVSIRLHLYGDRGIGERAELGLIQNI